MSPKHCPHGLVIYTGRGGTCGETASPKHCPHGLVIYTGRGDTCGGTVSPNTAHMV